jgi:hypothetical protein
MRILPWESKFGLKEMTTWVTLPRDFTNSFFSKRFFEQRYRDVVGHVS